MDKRQLYESSSAEISESLVFHKSRNTILGTQKNNSLVLFHDLDAAVSSYSFVNDYSTNHNLEQLQERSLKNIYRLSGKTLLQIDSSALYGVPGFHHEIILLTNSPRLNPAPYTLLTLPTICSR